MLRVLARQHRVRLGAGGDQDRARRQHDLLAGVLIRLGRWPPTSVGACRVSFSAAACPKTSTSTSTGVSISAKRMPSSIAFATSS